MHHATAPMIPSKKRTITTPMETVSAVPLLFPPAGFGLPVERFPELWLLGTCDEGGLREDCAPLEDGGGGDHCITDVGVDEFEGESEDGELLGDNAAGEGGKSLGGPEAGEGGELSDDLDVGDGGEFPPPPPSPGELDEGGEDDDEPFLGSGDCGGDEFPCDCGAGGGSGFCTCGGGDNAGGGDEVCGGELTGEGGVGSGGGEAGGGLED